MEYIRRRVKVCSARVYQERGGEWGCEEVVYKCRLFHKQNCEKTFETDVRLVWNAGREGLKNAKCGSMRREKGRVRKLDTIR